MKRWLWVLLVVLGLFLLAGVRALQVERRVERVAMRDGVRLATSVFLPREAGPHPTILIRTPYNKDGMAALGEASARSGYSVVIQDTRGRYASEGTSLAFEGDGFADHFDGLDTVTWIRKQPWATGKIGTMGGSALGITQLLMIGAGAPGIVNQQIHVAAPDSYHYLFYRGGVWRKALVEDWVHATGHSPESITQSLAHPTYDSYWKQRTLRGRWQNANAPSIHVGGWYDIFAQGTLDSFIGYQTQGGPLARGHQKVVMGPWTHGIFQAKAGELTFPEGNQPPNNVADPARWLNHYLKGQETGIEGEAAVTYYTMGDTSTPGAPGNQWHTSATWPLPSKEMRGYLGQSRGMAWTAGPKPGKLTYRYDPANPCPTRGGPQLSIPAGPMDQATVEARPDVLTFTSRPLDRPLEVTGPVSTVLWASSDCPDTDWVARLCDVYPDGRSINICEGILRARFRDGFGVEKLMKPGTPYRFVIDMWSTSMVFNKGHRLRLQVTSSCAPGYDPNPNTGARTRSDSRTRVATNTIYTEGSHASYVSLPVIGSK